MGHPKRTFIYKQTDSTRVPCVYTHGHTRGQHAAGSGTGRMRACVAAVGEPAHGRRAAEWKNLYMHFKTFTKAAKFYEFDEPKFGTPR